MAVTNKNLVKALGAVVLITILSGCTTVVDNAEMSMTKEFTTEMIPKLQPKVHQEMEMPIEDIQASSSAPIATEVLERDAASSESLKNALDNEGTNAVAISIPQYEDFSALLGRPLDTCKLQETSNIAPHPKGFSGDYGWSGPLPRLGKVKIAIIPVDFSDAPGGNEISNRLFEKLKNEIEAWSKYISRGNMIYEVVYPDSGWVRLPNASDWYTCSNCNMQGAVTGKQLQTHGEALQQIVNAADSEVDFSGTDFVVVIPPSNTKNFQLYNFWNVTSDEGAFGAFVMGFDAKDPYLWPTIIHEVLHPQGFVGHGPSNGSMYTIMANQTAQSKAVTAWEGFVNGWYGSSEILCVHASDISEESYFKLSSLDKFGQGYEAIIVKINNSEAVVIESRGPGPFSSLSSGIVAYRLNVNAPHFRCDHCSRNESDSKNWWAYLISNSGADKVSAGHFSHGSIRIKVISNNEVILTN